MKIHTLKTIPPYFEDVVRGRKTFEIRRNDRDYAIGDTLHLREYVDGRYTGREEWFDVTYITDYGQRPGTVVMAIRKSGEAAR